MNRSKATFSSWASRIVLAVLLLLITSLPLVAGGRREKREENGKLVIVTTTGMIADIATNLGGELIEVTALMGPGVDPHLYKASEGDVARLTGADLILFNGLHLESKMGEVLEKLNERQPTVAVAEEIDQAKLLQSAQYQDAVDPHIWFDVTLWLEAVDRTKEALIAIDPDNRNSYEANYEDYVEELEELHVYVTERAAELPEEKRILVTAHDAFSYFGRAYGFSVRGLQGISTVTEAGAADVRDLADFIVEKQISAIFIESSVSRKNVEALQAAVKSRDFDVAIGGELFSDAMGSPGTEEGTYIGMVRHNIDTIVNALKAGGP